jgi:hypothetical protein
MVEDNIVNTSRPTPMGNPLLVAAGGLARLERLVATVKGKEHGDAKFAAALEILDVLSRKEGIPIAIIGGLGAIHHGYERFTKDIDIVVGKRHLDPLLRVAPKYGIKVIWQDPGGWHKLRHGGVDIEIVPAGGEPRRNAPTTIPGLKQLGVHEGATYASLEGWMETKLASNRLLDRADVVQVMKKSTRVALRKVRSRLARVHRAYLRLFDELHATAAEEMEQERERGGRR